MQCFRCDQIAVQECARCGALYCDDHGDALCERCMDPNSALPSYRVYRGSLAALLIGSVFAIWLLVRPGTQGDFDGPPSALAAVLPSATATAAPASPRPTGPAGASPTASATPPPAAAPSGAVRPVTATATPAPSANRTHTVKSGDTLFGIVDEYRGAIGFQTYSERLFQLNRLTESSLIGVGDTIRLP